VGSAAKNTRLVGPGDRLAGKYELIRQLAVGGMAELYLARTLGIEGFEKLVAIKRILPQYMDDAHFVSMFLNEARLAATLHHPNIAQVFDIGVEQGDYFFSLEYVHGENLGQLASVALDSGVPLSLDAALTLIVGLCAGLHYAHDKLGPDGKPMRIVHRDVSPSNVLVTYDGAIKLVDFGIARQASGPQTVASGLKGKVMYMSPEQCLGKPLDRRSDLFSVGTMLYELTTGVQPFADHSRFATLEKIVHGDPAPPSSLVPSYPEALERIVLRALARDPDQRYATALELQGHLEDFAHDTRLRISPLVVARLMSTLFPARLEEWERARAQGAFFVEQTVLRTWIEKTGEGQPPADQLAPLPDPATPPATAEVGDTTARLPTPLPFATAVRVPTPAAGLQAITGPGQLPPAPPEVAMPAGDGDVTATRRLSTPGIAAPWDNEPAFAPATAGTFGLPARPSYEVVPRRPSAANFEETKLVRVGTRRAPLVIGVFAVMAVAGVLAGVLVSRRASPPSKAHAGATTPAAGSAQPLFAPTAPVPSPAETAPVVTPPAATPVDPTPAATPPDPKPAVTPPAPAPVVQPVTPTATAPAQTVQPKTAVHPTKSHPAPHPSKTSTAKPDPDTKETKWESDSVFLPERPGN
jgi:tRNA A-37 threonylcarbamoyl transferase component Bud32